MDRASASEAGNVGSTPAERILKIPVINGVFCLVRGTGKLLCLCWEEKTRAMFLRGISNKQGKKIIYETPRAYARGLL